MDCFRLRPHRYQTPLVLSNLRNRHMSSSNSRSLLNTRRVTLTGLLTAAGVLTVLATLVGFAARFWWMFELAAHFRVQYALALAFAALALTLPGWRDRRWALVFAFFALVNVVVIAPRFLPAATPSAATGAPTFRALLANVDSDNHDHDRIHRAIVTADPDFVMLLEVTPRLMARLADLSSRYPHRIAEPSEDHFGIALLSRWPLHNAAVIRIGPAGLPSIRADLDRGGQRFTLLGTHPPPPIGAEMAQDRNKQLADLAGLVRQIQQPVLLLGDLNLSPWSPYFTQLLADADLQDSAAGRGIQASWPVLWPPLWIPIDHALYSAGLRIQHREPGPATGSDHDSVMVDFQIAGSPVHNLRH